MTVWELVILILVGSLVSMVEICVILAAISRMIDAKTDAKIKLVTRLFENKMNYLEVYFNNAMDRIDKTIDKAISGKKE